MAWLCHLDFDKLIHSILDIKFKKIHFIKDIKSKRFIICLGTWLSLL